MLRDVGGVGGGGGAETLLLTEDDAVMCEGGLVWLGEAIASASRVDPRWSMVRTSVGFIGIATRRADASRWQIFGAALREETAGYFTHRVGARGLGGERAGEGRGKSAVVRGGGRANRPNRRGGSNESGSARRHFVAAKRVRHVGAVSSLRETGLGHGPQCGAALTSFLWATERFEDAAKCRGKGVVPCE